MAETSTAPAESEKTRILYWGSGSPPGQSCSVRVATLLSIDTAWRVLIALEEKKLSYRSELISFSSGKLKTPPFLSLNPRGLVPIFIDGDVVLYESLAILHYIESTYPSPSLLPADAAAKARALTRMHEANNVSSVAGEVVYYLRRTPPEEINHEYLQAKRDMLHKELSLWETYLAGKDFLAGSCGFTVADAAFFPNLAYMVRLGCRLGDRYPNLSAYFARMVGRLSVLTTWPPHWKESDGIQLLADDPPKGVALQAATSGHHHHE